MTRRPLLHVAIRFLYWLSLLAMPAVVVANPPLGLPPLPEIRDVRAPQKTALGERLFHDKALSADGKTSCATCHRPDMAFSDGRPTAEGVWGRKGPRNTPSLFNVAYLRSFFWDGRVASLETQVRFPFFSETEHGLQNEDTFVMQFRLSKEYSTLFAAAFGVDRDDIELRHVSEAIAFYERTLLAADSPFDRFYFRGDQAAIDESAKRGFGLFQKTGCITCHTIDRDGALFSDNNFHTIGIGLAQVNDRIGALAKMVVGSTLEARENLLRSDRRVSHLGRFILTGLPSDIGKFRTPSLRNVALTAPYMHDGSIATLEGAIEIELYYHRLKMNGVLLSAEEKADLAQFLRTLTSPR